MGVTKSQTWLKQLSTAQHSAYNFNKQRDNIQPCRIPFPTWNQSVASWPTYRFLRRQVRWSGIPMCLRIFRFVVIHTVKGFRVVNEAEVDIFLEFPCFPYDSTNVGNLISAFSKPCLFIWKFSVHLLLKPSLKDFEHNLTSMGSECNCPIHWAFFSITLLWNWDENWTFSVLWTLLGFPNFLAYWVQHPNCVHQIIDGIICRSRKKNLKIGNPEDRE